MAAVTPAHHQLVAEAATVFADVLRALGIELTEANQKQTAEHYVVSLEALVRGRDPRNIISGLGPQAHQGLFMASLPTKIYCSLVEGEYAESLELVKTGLHTQLIAMLQRRFSTLRAAA